MLYLDMAEGDTLVINNGSIRIEFNKKKGRKIKVGIQAKPDENTFQVVNKSVSARSKGLTIDK